MTDYLPGSIKHLNMLLGEQLTDGEGGGGGGSSDFSTAEVTINGDENFSIAMAVCNSQAPFDGLHIVTDLGEGGNYTTPLYKGKEYVVIRAEGEIALSGNIALVDVESSLYLITGDCTITIS